MFYFFLELMFLFVVRKVEEPEELVKEKPDVGTFELQSPPDILNRWSKFCEYLKNRGVDNLMTNL